MQKKKKSSRWEHKHTHPAVLDKVAAMEAKSIRREKKMDETGSITWTRVSKMEEKSQANADNKEHIRNSAYAAAIYVEGVYLTSGHQRKIANASKKIIEAQAVLQNFFSGVTRNRINQS